MSRVLAWHDALADYTVAAVRISQVFVIEVTDRLAARGRLVKHVGGCTLPALILNANRRWVGEPVAVVDRTRDCTARLIELHREFDHRLLDAVDGDVSVSAQPARPHAGATTNVDGNMGFLRVCGPVAAK